MSSLGILWLLFLQQSGAALGYVLFTHSARMGSNTTIPCKFDVNAVPPAQRTFSVIWQFQEKEIFRYPNNPGALNSRLSIDQDTIKDGIADLYMSGVSISDGGLYKCSMAQIPGEKEKEIRLDVYAPPRISIPDKNIIISKEKVLSCAVSGFYPVDIDIKWLRDGIILNNITLEKPQRDPGGMYSVRSSVTITPTEEDRKRIFSCRIQHESLTAPLREDFQLVYGDSTDTKSSTLYTIVIPVIAGVVILILIAVVAIFCVKRKKGQNKHHEDNLENQKENLLANNPSGLTPFPSQSVNAAGDPTPERSQRDVSTRGGTTLEEDHLPKKTQDYNKNLKSVTKKSNNQEKFQINDESSEAELPSSGQNKHHEDNLENQKENLLANNPSGLTPFPSQSVNAAGDPTPERSQTEDVSAREETRFEEDHLPNKPQDCNKNSKSVTEKSNNQDKSQINNESSEAELPSSAHGPTGKSDLVSERQQSCSEQSVTQHSPEYSKVLRGPAHHTSASGPEPVPAATQSNSHITSPPGTKDPRPSVDMHTRDSGRGQAEQQHKIGNLGGVNSAENWSLDSTRSPGHQKTTSFEGGFTSPAPGATNQFTDKKTEPSNQENSEYKISLVADRRHFFESKK